MSFARALVNKATLAVFHLFDLMLLSFLTVKRIHGHVLSISDEGHPVLNFDNG